MLRPELVDALSTLADDVATAVADGDTERLVRLWQALGDVKRDLDLLIREVDQAACESWTWEDGPNGKRRPVELELDGLGTVTTTAKSARTTWDREETAKRVVRAAMDGGQIAHPLDVADVLGRCARLEFRSTEVKALGIDPDEEDLRSVDRSGRTLRVLT